MFAIKALVDNSFEKIVNLNDNKMNYLFADLYAEKDGKKYVVSIKARNKYQKNNEINAFYKLGNKAYEKARSAESEFQAKAYWMAIQFDERTFTIYFGSLDELNNRNAIPIRECEERKIGICFVKDKRHYFDFGYFTNKKDKKTHNKGLHEDRRKKLGDL
ncbi:MAG: hypothetical protein Q8Q33_09495 [Chlamydiota bacterium]|nr:hypothetical protein [Chlamydiota bacterium]